MGLTTMLYWLPDKRKRAKVVGLIATFFVSMVLVAVYAAQIITVVVGFANVFVATDNDKRQVCGYATEIISLTFVFTYINSQKVISGSKEY